MKRVYMATNNELSKKILTENYEPQLKPFVEEFFQDRCSDLEVLKSEIKAGNWLEAKKLAHNWKGYAKPYGFAYLGELGAEIEKIASENPSSQKDRDNIEQLVETVGEYLKLKADQFNL